PGAFGKNFNYWTKIVHPDDLVVVRKEMEAAIQKHEEFDTEFRVITPEYGTHWLACRGKVFYDGKSNPLRMLGIIMDIHARKLSEHNARFLADASKVLASSLDYQ